MKIISAISRKGGAGKTTIAVNLALQAHALGLKVLLIDSDPQGSTTHSLRARQAPGPRVMAAAAGKLFQTTVTAGREGYDLVIIDTPAYPEADVALAVNCADLCLAVCRPTFLDIASVAQSAEMIRRLRRTAAVVLNQTPPARGDIEAPAVRKAIEALEVIGLPMAATVASRLAYQQSLANGCSAAEWGSEASDRELGRLWLAVERLIAAPPTASADAGPVRSTARALEAAPQLAHA
ncbi:MAG TPA: ParA family protein [Caulobacter sp.]|nr:ParA family protein [Caulobacter sp.]